MQSGTNQESQDAIAWQHEGALGHGGCCCFTIIIDQGRGACHRKQTRNQFKLYDALQRKLKINRKIAEIRKSRFHLPDGLQAVEECF